jgi:DNA modification methylase
MPEKSASSASWLDLRQGDALTVLKTLPERSVSCCVTSPPYWGLRDYGVVGQLGMEATPLAYLAAMVAVFEEVRRVLRHDGTLWLNMGDSYVAGGNGARDPERWPKQSRNNNGDRLVHGKKGAVGIWGLKSKDLAGMPWRLAFALQEAGWWLRTDIVWSKTNCMPESVKDRPTRSHEYLFLLAKSERYFYDFEAVAEPLAAKTYTTFGTVRRDLGGGDLVKSHNFSRDVAVRKPRTAGKHSKTDPQAAGHRIVESVANARAAGGDHDNPFGFTRNRRTVWEIAAVAYPEAHFATFPPALVEPCILAGCPEGGVVLDPFLGSGTTAYVANRLGRRALGVELNPAYLELARARCNQVTVWEGSATG